MNVDEDRNLCSRVEVINHLSDPLPIVDPVIDVFFVFRVDVRLEVPDQLAKHQHDQGFMLHALSPLKTDAEGFAIFLRRVGRQLFRIEESPLDTISRIKKLLGLWLYLNSVNDGHRGNGVATIAGNLTSIGQELYAPLELASHPTLKDWLDKRRQVCGDIK